jgi:hypothetical protein
MQRLYMMGVGLVQSSVSKVVDSLRDMIRSVTYDVAKSSGCHTKGVGIGPARKQRALLLRGMQYRNYVFGHDKKIPCY